MLVRSIAFDLIPNVMYIDIDGYCAVFFFFSLLHCALENDSITISFHLLQRYHAIAINEYSAQSPINGFNIQWDSI